MTCTPYDSTTHSGGFCIIAGICKLLGVRYDESCMKCFAAAGITFDNNARPEHWGPEP